MKARLVPVYFKLGRDTDFDVQLERLKTMLAEDAEFLPPAGLGDPLPASADAVIFPQFLGEAYRTLDDFKNIDLPILVITSEFGTVLMWDWEIVHYLRAEGVDTIAPPSLEQTRKVCKALSVKRGLKDTRFLVFQDNPGEGMQAEIFKRFYWWEPECLQRMGDKFGVTIIKKSFQAMAAEAKAIPDAEAEAVLKSRDIPHAGLAPRQLLSAVKVYLAVKRELEKDAAIGAVGINCLNESRFSDTVPCLAWNLLYEEQGMMWGCEADVVSMLTKYLLHKSLDVPIMMTNLYPFVMGQAALKHERIPHFPEVMDNPDNYILAAHCGYLGVVPQSFATEWKMVPKVLAIVDENATVIDARLPEGPMTLAKLDPRFDHLSVAQGYITSYAQYPGSDCRNGAVLKVSDGRRLVNNIASHHYLLMTGYNLPDIEMLAKVFDLKLDVY
jgi:hypothetical protein